MVLNRTTGHVSTQLHVVFDDKFSIVPFTREVTILPNCTDIVQRSSQNGAPDNIYLKETWFAKDPEEDPSETITHLKRVAPDNNRNMPTFSESVPQVQ